MRFRIKIEEVVNITREYDVISDTKENAERIGEFIPGSNTEIIANKFIKSTVTEILEEEE